MTIPVEQAAINLAVALGLSAAIGFERVPMVEDVAQFSVRGGIFDIYSFGMAEPIRLEFWGDDIAELRHFDLVTQRSTRDADLANQIHAG